MPRSSESFIVIFGIFRRPWLWIPAVRAVWRTRPWPREWRDARAQIYGVDRLSQIPTKGVIDYLEWCRRFPKRRIT